MGHPPLFKRALVAYVDGANSLSWSFIGFECKPNYAASFSPLIFLLHYSFLMTQLFTLGGQSIGVSALSSVLQ